MRRTLALLDLAAAWVPLAAQAQPPPNPPPIEITVRPAAEPVPALKYRLVPERRTLVPGNAAIFYHRALHFLAERRTRVVGEKDEPVARPGRADEEAISRWSGGPIAEIPREEARKKLEAYESVLKEVELGAQRSTCDWEFDQRTEGMYLMLPELQEMRALARLVAVRARLAILDGKTDEAMHWIETGLVMGRHVGQGPLLIQALVAVAIDSLMAKCLEELIQAPGTPSLYWALADRPRPFVDVRDAMESEGYPLETELPEMRELDRGPWSLDEARRFVEKLESKLYAMTSGSPIPGTSSAMPTDLRDLTRRLGIAAMAAKVYPEATRALVARGKPEAQVEAMPIVQVAALYALQEYQRLRDDSFKWMNLPYWQSFDRVDRTRMTTQEQKMSNPLLTMFQMLTPSLNPVRLAPLKLDRQLDALQCIEAIRLYAFAHDGKLPATLEGITESPVPVDPATGKPFVYEAYGNSATLSAPVPPGAPNHPLYSIRYVLKPAR
jgi:hypothetical protein